MYTFAVNSKSIYNRKSYLLFRIRLNETDVMPK